MKLGRLRTRSFVAALVAWSALAAAPIAALSPPLATSVLLIAFALTAGVTLLFSLRAGIVIAVLTGAAFWFALALLAAGPQGAIDGGAVLAALVRVGVALPGLLSIVGLAGAVSFAELVSMGLEWDLLVRGGPARASNGFTASGGVRVNRERRDA